MLKATLPSGTVVGFDFWYIGYPDRKGYDTSCVLYDTTMDPSNPRVQMGHGRATCHEADTPNKELGRKLALTRALADTYLTKDQRTAVWQAYHGRRVYPAINPASIIPDKDN